MKKTPRWPHVQMWTFLADWTPGWPQTSPDLLRAMLKTFAQALMSAEADAVCGAAYAQRSQERVNRRNGYRQRDWDTRAGTVELAIPKLRRQLLPGLTAGTPRSRRAGAGRGGGGQLPAGRVDPAGGAAGRDPGRDPAVEVAGQPDGQEPGRAGRRVLQPLDAGPHAFV
jgi:Transposase, Mutator family